MKRKVVHNSKIKGTFMCAHANNASILSLNYSHYPHHHHNCDRDSTLDLLEKDQDNDVIVIKELCILQLAHTAV